MNHNRLIKISKYLSYHLRHCPDKIGLTLKPGGWVSVNELLIAAAKDNFPMELMELQEVVRTNDKKRFSFDETGSLIRANQGHSIKIDLQLKPQEPPILLYHGTAQKNVVSILNQGLGKMARHHVHLSSNIETARSVGARHGIPVVFTINAVAMYNNGYRFYCSENGVWLVDFVPREYIEIK
jgi:putative RNA 2'-phosphotransferase